MSGKLLILLGFLALSNPILGHEEYFKPYSFGIMTPYGGFCSAQLLNRNHLATVQHCYPKVKSGYSIFYRDYSGEWVLARIKKVLSITAVRISGLGTDGILVLRMEKPIEHYKIYNKLGAFRQGQSLYIAGQIPHLYEPLYYESKLVTPIYAKTPRDKGDLILAARRGHPGYSGSMLVTRDGKAVGMIIAISPAFSYSVSLRRYIKVIKEFINRKEANVIKK